MCVPVMWSKKRTRFVAQPAHFSSSLRERSMGLRRRAWWRSYVLVALLRQQLISQLSRSATGHVASGATVIKCVVKVEKKSFEWFTKNGQDLSLSTVIYIDRHREIASLSYVVLDQGGPGGSSCGFGNFGEIGPLDTDLQPRETSWVSVKHLSSVIYTKTYYVEHCNARGWLDLSVAQCKC